LNPFKFLDLEADILRLSLDRASHDGATRFLLREIRLGRFSRRIFVLVARVLFRGESVSLAEIVSDRLELCKDSEEDALEAIPK